MKISPKITFIALIALTISQETTTNYINSLSEYYSSVFDYKAARNHFVVTQNMNKIKKLDALAKNAEFKASLEELKVLNTDNLLAIFRKDIKYLYMKALYESTPEQRVQAFALALATIPATYLVYKAVKAISNLDEFNPQHQATDFDIQVIDPQENNL